MIKGSQDRSGEEWMQKRLQVLRDMPGVERSPDAEKAGQARFLSQAAALRKAAPAGHSYRDQGLWGTLRSFISGKQARLAFYTATVLCVVLGLMLASGGTVVYASQGSQPGQVLYPVKLISENVALELASSPQAQFNLNMEFAGRRLDEIGKLVQAGKDPGAQVADRLQNELNAAFDNAANLDNAGSVKALENLQANLLKHQNQLLKLQSQANPHAVANYTRVVEMLQQKVDQAEQGIKDPQSIHQMLKQQKKQDKQLSKASPTPSAAPNNPQNAGSSTQAASTPAAPAATAEQKNNPGQCNNPNKSNNGNGNSNGNGNNSNGNGNPCAGPDTQVTAPPAHPNAATNEPKPDNPNKPDKAPKDPPENGNKGGNGHKK